MSKSLEKAMNNTLQTKIKAHDVLKKVSKSILLRDVYKKTLLNLHSVYKEVGIGRVSNEAGELAKKISDANETSAIDAFVMLDWFVNLKKEYLLSPSSANQVSLVDLDGLIGGLCYELGILQNMSEIMTDYLSNISVEQDLFKTIQE